MARKKAEHRAVQTGGRKCSICAHADVKAINASILKAVPFRVISGQVWGNDSKRSSLMRHTDNCLNAEIAAVIQQQKVKTSIDAFTELCEQLEFAKQLREAARDYLSDQDGKIALIPRTDEIEVLYVDTSGEFPVKCRALLSELLEKASNHGVMTLRPQFKHMDLRKFALDAIGTADPIIDKFLKIEGLYTKERENGDVVTKAAEAIRMLLDKYEGANRDDLIDRYSTAKNIDRATLAQELGRVG